MDKSDSEEIVSPSSLIPGATSIRVGGMDPYTVLVGRDLSAVLPGLLGSAVSKVLIIHQPSIREFAEQMRESLTDSFEVFLAEVPDAEAAKRSEVAEFCWKVLGQQGFTRSDAVVGLGGGAVTDLAGFVSATWMRGVRCVLVPTSVAGMVDAAIGGKTGINTAEGKNLVGTFTPPAGVVVDFSYLDTLPRTELIAGFAEVVKAGFIYFPEILQIIEDDVERATDPTSPAFRRLVELAIEMKARVVSEDFRESGLREILNYGHTLGHAIEHAERYQWRHGAAISVGMFFAAELSHMMGKLSASAVEQHRRILTSLGLPISYSPRRWDSLLSTMSRDKKARGAVMRFVILTDVGKPSVIAAPDISVLHAAYREITEDRT